MSPDSCASSHTKKSTKFLNMVYLFFFNSQKYFWHSDYLPFSCKFLHNLAPHPCPHHPQSSSLRVTWDAISWAWSPKNSHWVKHNSQLLGCDYFLSWQSTGPGSVGAWIPRRWKLLRACPCHQHHPGALQQCTISHPSSGLPNQNPPCNKILRSLVYISSSLRNPVGRYYSLKHLRLFDLKIILLASEKQDPSFFTWMELLPTKRARLQSGEVKETIWQLYLMYHIWCQFLKTKYIIKCPYKQKAHWHWNPWWALETDLVRDQNHLGNISFLHGKDMSCANYWTISAAQVVEWAP